LLQRLVTDALTGTVPEEYRLGIDLFNRLPDWAPLEDNIVRQHMTRLRKLLDGYYRSEGIEDRLNLELRGYKPVFSYYTCNPLERALRLALKILPPIQKWRSPISTRCSVWSRTMPRHSPRGAKRSCGVR
jgi:hypothetical protein